MWLSWSLLLILTWWHTIGASAHTEVLVRSHRRAFSFQDLPPGNGTLSSVAALETLGGVSACECRARCLANHTCRGYGTRDVTKTCLLTESLPTPQRMETSPEDWRWHARNGVRLLDEPCEDNADCSLLVPGAICVKNVCQCRASLERVQKSRQLEGQQARTVGGCEKAGSFIEVTKRKLTSGFLSAADQTSVDGCKDACAGNLSCVAVEFSAAHGLCKMFSEGVTNEAVSGGDVQSFVWSFAHAEGMPPDTYQQVGSSFLRLLPPGSGLKAANACFRDGAILFPYVTQEGLSPFREFIAKNMETNVTWIGLEDMLEEGSYVTSDGREMNMADINWEVGQPNGGDGQACAIINKDLFVRDEDCLANSFNALCLHIGENLALRKTSWMSAVHSGNNGPKGNDGSENTFVRTPVGRKHQLTPTWTVDLGGPVQVISILYVARVNCSLCQNERNRLTEIRVGSDPVKFDDQHSARCVWLEKTFVARDYARLFRCSVPLTGRYVRLSRKKRMTVDFAELAVFGNRLQF